MSVLTSARYAGLSPKQLVPQLADEGLYLASESTMYRNQRRYRFRTKRRAANRKHVSRAPYGSLRHAAQPCLQLGLTRLPTVVRGSYPRGVVLHSNNGAAMRGNTMISTLQWLGVVPSFSRPHVSDDNPYSEALFRTLKHTPAYPRLPFADTSSAQRWVDRFVDWYNGMYRHSAIRYVTPDERYFGHEHDVVARRRKLYVRARSANPERWTGAIRNWTPIGSVTLNPQQVSSSPAETTTRQQS